jgi:hypothetical protein
VPLIADLFYGDQTTALKPFQFSLHSARTGVKAANNFRGVKARIGIAKDQR